MNAVYEHAVSTVKKQRPELLDKMTKSVGFAMGIEFREGSLLLSGKNNLRIRKGNYVVMSLSYYIYTVYLFQLISRFFVTVNKFENRLKIRWGRND